LLERELKSLVTKEEYDNLIRHPLLAVLQTSNQTHLNYYYDTEDLTLTSLDVTVRVRQVQEQLMLEIKKPLEVKDAYKVKQEVSYSLDCLPSYVELGQYFPALAGQRALITFPLLTERSSYLVSDQIRIDVDRSSYLGNVDYEMEIEFHEGVEREAEEWFHQLLPSKRLQRTAGKKTRFFRAYQRMMQEGRGLLLDECER